MYAEFTQDGLEQGYARVILSMEDGDKPFSPGDSIAIGRMLGTDNWEYIGRNGHGSRSPSPEPLKLKTKPEVDGENVIFELQPAYVDIMEDGPYTVKLLGPDGTEKGEGAIFVDNVSWSGLDSTDNLKDYTEEEEERERKKQEEVAQLDALEEEKRNREKEEREKAEREKAEREKVEKEQSEAAAATAAAASPTEAKAETDSIIRHEQAIHDNADSDAERAYVENEAISESQFAQREQEARAELDLASPELDERPKKGNRGLVAVAIVVLLLAIGGGFYVWHSQKAAEEAARLAAEAQAKMEAQQKAARANAKGRVAAFFAGNRTPDGAMELAKELDSDTPEQKDAIFRLYYYAAEQGNPEGALRYAECVDPSKPAWGSIKKDGAEAWDNYGKSQQGEAARAALKQWTEKAAAEGNAEAAGWLSRME